MVTKALGRRALTLMNVRLVIMNVTQTPTASIPLAHTAVSVNLVTKGTDSLVNLMAHAQVLDVTLKPPVNKTHVQYAFANPATKEMEESVLISMSAWEMSTNVIKKLSVSTLWDLITVLANLDLKAMDITASRTELVLESCAHLMLNA